MPRLMKNFVSKIPRDFKRRVLLRLLPSLEILGTLARDQLARLLLKKREIEHIIDIDPLRFFQPISGGQEGFLTAWDRATPLIVAGFFAGNKTGKSTSGAVQVLERLLGKPLWGREFRSWKLAVPARGCVFAEDFDSHKEVTVPQILSWCPKSDVKRLQYNNLGHVVEIEFTNGSMLAFKTYAQGSDTVEGKDWDIAWCDEPPPQAFYTAIFRGLVVTGGRLCITATLLKESWLFDEAGKDSVKIFQADIEDNHWLSAMTRQAFLDSLPPEEREVRKTGKPIALTGLVYKELRNEAPWIVTLKDLPKDWPIILGVDPHERKPVHCLWGFLSPQDEIIFFDWKLIQGSKDDIIEMLMEVERSHPSISKVCVMDPNRGAAIQIDQLSWSMVFEEAGYDVILGNDDLKIGHTQVRSYLALNPITKRPRMMFARDLCDGRGGPIWQMFRYAWADWTTRQNRASRDPKETPRDSNKDFPDIVRYIAMEDLRFDILSHGPEIVSRLRNFRAPGRPYRKVA